MSLCERRSFLGETMLAGVGALATASGNRPIEAAQGVRKKLKSPSSLELIHVGFLGCDPSGHLAIWGPLINPTDGWTRRTGMVISHCWDIDKNDEERFATTYGCERVKNYNDMIGKVDGIIIPSFDTAFGINKHLVKPYLEAGIPTFINRPFAFNMADAEAIVQLSKKTGTPIMCGSAYEFCKEVPVLQGPHGCPEHSAVPFHVWGTSCPTIQPCATGCGCGDTMPAPRTGCTTFHPAGKFCRPRPLTTWASRMYA